VSIVPNPVQGNPASFTFTAAVGDRARAVFRAVSKAGVAEGEWVQPIKNFSLRKIAGNFTGSADWPVGTSGTGHFSWNGGATFERNLPAGYPGALGGYNLIAGTVTYTASGFYTGGDAACNMSGSRFFDLPHGSGSLSVNPVDQTAPFRPGPHEYNGRVPVIAQNSTMTVTLSGCADPSVNDEQRTVSVGGDPLDMGSDPHRSDDGINYAGSYSRNDGGVAQDWSWTLMGSTN
jgi:hypothetical protein